MIEKKDIINLLDDIADMLEFRGENTFKVNAYRMGAVAVRKTDGDIEELIKSKQLHNIKGIGKGLQGVIYEYYEAGKSLYLEELLKDIPPGVKDLMKIKGLGPRKISLLYKDLNISNLSDLREAAEENSIATIKGFGASLQSTILEEIERINQNSGFLLLNQALAVAEEIQEKISSFTSVKRAAISGQVKRRLEVVSSVELTVEVNNYDLFLEQCKGFVNYEINDDIILIKGIYPVLIKVYPCIKNFIFVDFMISADPGFITNLPPVPEKNYQDENDVFKTIKMSYVIPEMREKEYFLYKKPANSDLEVKDITGLLHFHTTFSDGRNTLKEMLQAAKSKGYQYAAVCDHSKSAYYANGLDESRILLQNNEINELQKNLGIPVLRGIESDILRDGSLDYPEDILKQFQFIVASVHSRFKQDEKEMTQRLVKAAENPFTDIIGHMSGRLLLSREPYKFNVEKVLDACAANRVAVEINANPRRLDIDWRLIYKARDKGCLFAVNADAHSIAEIDLIKYGVMTGRKGGLQKEEVINCFNREKFINFLNQKRKRPE